MSTPISKPPRIDTNTSLHGVAIYNPSLWSRKELKDHFVARVEKLERIIDDLRREQAGHSPQHRLILGQRGMGKTTLLRRIAIAVSEDPDLSPLWTPLTFPEEQYNIAHPADLWLNCLDALGDHLEEHDQSEAAARIDILIEQLPRKDANAALQALLNEGKHLDTRFLLLIDNIDLVLDRLKDEQWAIREILESQPGLLVIGASARAVEASYQYDAAFYDFFKVDELRGLNEAEMQATLLRLAELGNTPAISELIRREPARIKTLHTLTGGNPRTVSLLYNVLAQGLAGDVRSDLEGLLDQVTPLYKARFEELAPQAQQVVDGLAVHWDPITAKALTERLGWQVNAVSAQLARLEQVGVVEKTLPAQGKRHAFQIAERFFNIWYLMRASRRVRRKLFWLARFLKMFFEARELEDHARSRLQGQLCSNARDAEYQLALATTIDTPALRGALETQALQGLLSEPKSRHELHKMLDLNGEDATLKPKAERIAEHLKIREQLEAELPQAWTTERRKEVIREYLACRVYWGATAVPHWPITDNPQDRDTQDFDAWAESLSVRLTTLKQRYSSRLYDALLEAASDGDLVSAHDMAGAESAAERLGIPALHAFILFESVDTDSPEAAIQRYQQLLASYENQTDADLRLICAQALYNKGVTLGQLNRFEEEIAIYDELLERYANDPETGLRQQCVQALHNKGFRLGQLNRSDEQIAAYHQAIEFGSQDAINGLAWTIYKSGGDLHEAQKLARQAVSASPDDANPSHTLATILLAMANWTEAQAPLCLWLQHADARPQGDVWEDTLIAIHEAVHGGFTAQVLTLLDDQGLSERWRPLREALASLTAESPNYLNGIAPEVREAAEVIAQRLRETPVRLRKPSR